MEQMKLDSQQKKIIDAVKKDPYLRNRFYFTGGTALSACYLHHRLSEDLDLFSERKFNAERVIRFMNETSKKERFVYKMRQPEGLDILVFSLEFINGGLLKVDFNYYPYKKIEKRNNIEGILVDNLLDIGANKLLTINQRTEVKDFVDLYFLLQKYTTWDLLYAAEVKFHMEFDILLIAADFLKVEVFKSLPKMLVPLKLIDLYSFFRQTAKELGGKVVK